MRKSNITMGIDLGDRSSYVYCLAHDTGEVLLECRVGTNHDEMDRLFRELPPLRVVLETGTHANWVARLAESHGHEVIVAQARRLRMIYQNPRKSDSVDAHMLAELGGTHPELLHPIHVRDATTQARLSRLRARESLVESRTRLVNTARGLVKANGARLPGCSADAFARRAAEHCPPAVEPAIAPLLESIAALSAQIRVMDRDLEELAREHYAPAVGAISSIPGVGTLTALSFVLVVGDPERFPSNRTVGAYLGLVPRRDQSGDSDRQLPISKCGDAMLRRLLVQCAQWILGPNRPDSDLRRWGLARAERGGKNAKRRAVVAVARRLSVLMLALWRSGETYVPLREDELALASC